MPYDSTSELPEDVRDALPKHAQEIFKEAFNSAWDRYADPEERRDNQSREQTAIQIAWSAVKKSYEKKNGNWQKKE